MYHWSEISGAPQHPGVYAWYYEVKISEKDIEILKSNIEEAQSVGSVDAIEVVKDFLNEKIFNFFEEGKYNVDIYGSLKPSYKGSIDSQSSVSKSLSKRILNDPDRIEIIRKCIGRLVPKFTSPIYIGKSENLRRRLRSHKKMIINKKEGREAGKGKPLRDRNFAQRVVENSMQPSFLHVETEVINSKGAEVDIENILNRISFPIFGRR